MRFTWKTLFAVSSFLLVPTLLSAKKTMTNHDWVNGDVPSEVSCGERKTKDIKTIELRDKDKRAEEKHGNAIKVGKGKVKVILKGDSLDADKISVWVSNVPIFSGLSEEESHLLPRADENGGNSKGEITFEGTVPMELEEDFIGIVIETPGPGHSPGFPLEIRQSTPKEVTIELNADGSLKSFSDSDPDAYSVDELTAIVDAVTNYYRYPVSAAPAELYKSWEDVRKFEMEELLPNTLQLTFGNVKVPERAMPWLRNRVLARFASQVTIPYTAAAKRENRIDVEEPPMEAYTFLDSIDYSDILLKNTHMSGLKPFLYTLLRFPEGGFEKIGETPVNVWKEKAAAKLSRAIKEPAPLLLDLLSAMSYVEQIDEKNENLTQIQIDNIKAGYENDLGKIILTKDSLLRSRRENTLINLEEKCFDLKAYIDEHYQGQPVIVDLWNTWCGPCIDAINMTNEIKKALLPKDNNIVFLYIGDVSSPLNEWEKKALATGGYQVRISSDDRDKLFEDFALENAFPVYMVFDKEHNVIYKGTGFPGTDIYVDWLMQLFEKQ